MSQIIRRQVMNLSRNVLCNHQTSRASIWLRKPLELVFGVRSAIHASSTYEGDGKTSVTMLNSEQDLGLLINSYSQLGFRLNNSMFVLGPMAIFPKTVLSWNVETHEDINENTLSLIKVLDPKVDLLILGIGDADVTPAFTKKVIEFMKKYKINVEVLKTEAACATFNFLNAESRMVAGLLIPPIHIRINEDDLMRRTTRGNYFKIEDDMDVSVKEFLK